jgi:Golgi phosphoprotein 3 (GPP34)
MDGLTRRSSVEQRGLGMAESVAETFFLIAVDETGGRQRVRPEAVYSGVTGGVFADLALRRFLRVDDSGLVRPTSVTSCSPTGSAAAHVLEAVAQQERILPVQDWIEEIGPAVGELVYRELAGAAVIRREHVRGLRPRDTYPAVNLVAAATPRLELARMLCDPRAFTFSGERSRPVIRQIMAELAEHLPGDLRAITSGVRSAVPQRASLAP